MLSSPSCGLLGLPLIAGLLAISSAACARTWTNDQGKAIEADFSRVRDGTVFLKTDDGVIPAPINRLSEADQQWLERHRTLQRPRKWANADGNGQRGSYVTVVGQSLLIKQGSERIEVPFESLDSDDWKYLEELHEHLEKEMPASTRDAQQKVNDASLTPASRVDGPEREWVDVNGRKIVARFAGHQGDRVMLLMKGRAFAFPATRLCLDDQIWIAEQYVGDTTLYFGMLGSSSQSMLPSTADVFASLSAAIPESETNRTRPTSRQSAPSLLNRSQAPVSVNNSADSEVEASRPEVEKPSDNKGESSRREPINHIDDLDEEEYEARLEEAFGDPEFADFVGLAACDNCEAGFAIPATFVKGAPCPFCRTPVTELVNFEELEIDFGGESSTPWYLRRWSLRILFFLLIAGAGSIAKWIANAAVTGET